jgi:hypothetical protein
MTRFGYTLMTEQGGPKELVRYAVSAERAGFDFEVDSARIWDVADSIPCGPDLHAIVEAVRKYWEAGLTDIAPVQIGDDGQELFLKEAAGSLLEKLRIESD